MKKQNTLFFEKTPYVLSFASAVGKKEKEGPLGKLFDITFDDEMIGTDSFEKAESELQKAAAKTALKKAGLEASMIDYCFAGDLLDQCTASGFGEKELNVPFIGMYGACSTMGLTLLTAANFIASGAAKNTISVTSSHFCSSERQFRFPLEYGSQRTPTAQWTVTGSGAVVLTDRQTDIAIKSVTAGKIVDYGVKDANNMGAAMAPAAADTIKSYFEASGKDMSHFDRIVTGDLGAVGSQLLYDLLRKEGINLAPKHDDCGLLMFDRESQDVHAGGSGCGCSASVLCSYLLPKMKKGSLKNLLFCPTGALLSPTSTLQGQTIPSICHAIELKYIED